MTQNATPARTGVALSFAPSTAANPVNAPNEQARSQLAISLQTALAREVSQSRDLKQSSVTTRPTKTISFAADLISAILAGRKAETRRLIRPQPKRKPGIGKCAIARPGDLLAVREPWAKVGERYVYTADGKVAGARYLPAMYMPRAASRLTLRVTGVRAERLCAITSAAARAEGAPVDVGDPVRWFGKLWDSFFTTPGERFADDPFVWVIRFELWKP